MSEFVFLFRSDEAGAQEAIGTAERMQKSLQAYMAWIGELEANGNQSATKGVAGDTLTHV